MSRKKFARIKLSLLLNLVVGAVFILAAVLVVTLVNGQTRREALIEAKAKDTIILNRNLATHTYFSHQLKPKLFEWTEAFRDDDYFDPSWMSSTLAGDPGDRLPARDGPGDRGRPGDRRLYLPLQTCGDGQAFSTLDTNSPPGVEQDSKNVR